MKKSYLLLLAILPIFSSCNKNSGFANPFPNDTYNKIGFKTNDVEITRPLTTDETNLVLKMIESDENKAKYDALVFSNGSKDQPATRYTRDYTRAFAGEFKQGYNVSNIMKNEKFTVVRQDEDASNSVRARTHINTETLKTSQYSYGEITENFVQDDYYHFNDENSTETKFIEANTKGDSFSLNNRCKVVENSKYTKVTNELLVKKDEGYVDNEINAYLHLHQSNYISAPDNKSGADKDGNIILVKATQTAHKDTPTSKEGIFTLKDGRSYQAMDNSLTVTKLKVLNDGTYKVDPWCLATYVRIYKETVITSEVIQPNVQVTKLKSPITISFSEERNYFSDSKFSITENLPGESE